MKTDIFVKVMLVIIAGLLFLNCFNSGSSIFPPKAKASVPDFFTVGKTYKCAIPAYMGSMSGISSDITIASIDKDDGWIQNKEGSWENTSLYHRCQETPAK